MKRCVRFKMTPAGRRCAKFAGRSSFGDLGEFGAPKKRAKGAKGAKKRSAKIAACVDVRGRGIKAHVRSCPKSCTLPDVPGYKPSKDKRAFLASACKRGRRR